MVYSSLINGADELRRQKNTREVVGEKIRFFKRFEILLYKSSNYLHIMINYQKQKS